MTAATKRWGAAGVNYFANLTVAGHGTAAAILQTLPSYARSVIAAEQNMRTLTLSPGMLLGQLKALKQDLLDPEIMENAARRARLQTENALMSLKIAGGALGGLSAFQKEVENAKAAHDKSVSALEMAGKEKQDVSRLHAMLSKQFLSNAANTAIGNSLLAVIDRLQATAEKYRKAEGDAANSQNMLTAAQQKYDTANLKIMGPLRADVKKEIEQRQKEAQLQWLRSGDPSLIVSILKNHPEFNFYTLAPNAGSDIMKGHSEQGAAGNAAGDTGGKDGAADKGSNQYSHLGIVDADYQAYLEGKLTEDDLIGIANAAAYYEAASGSGAGRFLYQNEAHKWAAKIRAKYDPNYIKNDTYDYTHSGLYDPNRVEPMPGPPVFKVLTSLPEDGDQDNQALGKNGQGQEQGITPTDLLASVIPPEHLQTLQEINDQFLKLLSDEERQRIDNGESVYLIISTLDEEKQAQIVQWEQTFLSSLSPEQKKDVMFLGSGLLDGKDLATRQAILNRLKKNEGKITYEDLVDLGVCEPGTLSENGFIRWWQNFGGGPDVFSDMLEKEYQLITDFGMTFWMADQEFRKQFEAQRAMAVTLLIAPALGSLADRAVNGSALSPKEMFDPNSRLDSIEWNGWSIKGPQSYIPAPEAAESPGGQPVAGAVNSWYKADGKITMPPNNGAVPGTEKIIELQPGNKLGRFGGYAKTSDFVATPGSDADTLSLPPYTDTSIFQEFTILKPISGVRQSIVAPWGGSVGGGTQFKLPMTIEDLLFYGYIGK